MLHSHFLLLLLFGFFVSLVFGVLGREAPREQARLGGLIFAGFIASALVIGWLMFPIPI